VPDTTSRRALAIIERPYRGSVETQFADVFYFLRELNRQLPGLDLALRGLGATCALKFDRGEELCLGVRRIVLPNQERAVRDLVDEGSSVWVEAPDLPAIGATPDRLLDGVACVPAGETLLRWPDYHSVWFI
jgi:hypothetical protein